MNSLFKHSEDEQEYYDLYDKSLELFEIPYTALTIVTSFGDTHVLQIGDNSKPPLL